MASDLVEIPAATPWRRDPRFWLGAGIVVLVLAGALVAVYLARRSPSTAAARLPSLAPFNVVPGFVRGDVTAVAGDGFSLAVAGGGTRPVPVVSDTRVESLVPARPASIAVGDYLTVGGAPNLVLSFAVKLVVDIPAAEAQDSVSGPPRSKGGFTGWEAYTTPMHAPEVYGRVESIDADGVHLGGPLGSIKVTLDDQSTLRRLTPGGLDLIHGGDHVALPSAAAAAPTAVLVMGDEPPPPGN